jgi:nucleoside-diphosphate-sugar epimerase
MKQKVLVTGSTGFIGSHIADELLRRGYQVRCTIRKTSNLQWLKDKPIELIETSFNNLEQIKKAVDGVDYIIHNAGAIAAKSEEDFMNSNFTATKNLLDIAIELAPNLKKFIFISSQTVSGPASAFDKPVREEDGFNPLSPYARSKKAAEEYVLSKKESFPILILRPSAVYGPRDPAILEIFQMVNKGLATLIGFKPHYINLIHSTDLVKAIADAMESDKTTGNIYFLASEVAYSWDQIMNILKKHLNKKFLLKLKIPHFLVLGIGVLSGFFGKFSKKPPIFYYEKAVEFIQEYWICSVEKAQKDFNFKTNIPLENGLKETIDWYKANNWLK